MHKSKQKKIQPSGLLRIGFAFHSPFSIQECISSLETLSVFEFSRIWTKHGRDSIHLKITIEPVDEYSTRFVVRRPWSNVRGTLGQSGESTHVVGYGGYNWHTRLPMLVLEAFLIPVICFVKGIPLNFGVLLWMFLISVEFVMSRHYQNRIANIVINTLSK
jgi:hypothetical protein